MEVLTRASNLGDRNATELLVFGDIEAPSGTPQSVSSTGEFCEFGELFSSSSSPLSIPAIPSDRLLALRAVGIPASA